MDMKYNGSADIYITHCCNENCIFCSAQKGNELLQFDNFMCYVNNWMEYGITHINITGGEPLLHPELSKFVTYANNVGMKVALFSNGDLLTKVDYASILSQIEWFAISIDGDQESNIELGRGSEHYNLAFESLRLIKANYPNVKIRIATVVTKNNQNGIFNLGEALIQNNLIPDLWRIKQVIPVRRATENWDKLSINDADYDNFTEQLIKRFGSYILIKPNKWQSKSGDLIVTYPSGDSGVTIIDTSGNIGNVVQLGNIFNSFDDVLSNWKNVVGKNLKPSENYMNEAWNK